MEKFKAKLKLWFVDALGAMAYGLFATLLIGTIIKTVGTYTGLEFLNEMGAFCQQASGMAIGVAIALAMKADRLVVLSAAVVGYMGYALGSGAATAGPAGSFVAVVFAVEIGMLVSRKTKVDILVSPLVTISAGFAAAKLCCPAIGIAMQWLGDFINTATEYQPFIMGVVISVVVGIILTLPISSAAICSMIGIAGLAGGAATVGCCAQMVGFAVISFRENGFNGVISQGLGTSMIQMGNICKNPRIWIPPTLAAAITGPLSTLVFKLECEGISAGMGTCGLVGPIGIISATPHSATMWIGLVLLCIVAPAALSLLFSEILRKIGWIKEGDMKI